MDHRVSLLEVVGFDHMSTLPMEEPMAHSFFT